MGLGAQLQPGTARLVLLSIADRVADDQCVSWASLSSLAKRTNASISTVREAIDRLVHAGELEQLDDLTGPQRSTVYRLPLAAQAVAETAQDEATDQAPRGEHEAAPPCGSRSCGGTESGRVRYRNPREGPESGSTGTQQVPAETGTPTYRKPAQRCTGNRHTEP